jgi:hypothetical protein
MVVCILSVNEQNLQTCIFNTCHKTNVVVHVCKMPTVHGSLVPSAVDYFSSLVPSTVDYSHFLIVCFYRKNTHFLSSVHAKQGQKREKIN